MGIAIGRARETRVGERDVRARGCPCLLDDLASLGFTEIFHLAPELAQQRYFANRNDELRAPRWEQLIAAVL